MSAMYGLVAAAFVAFSMQAEVPKANPKTLPYPLKKCIVTDEDLDKDAHVFIYKGQELKTCCKGCKDDFDAEPAKYLKKLPKLKTDKK